MRKILIPVFVFILAFASISFAAQAEDVVRSEIKDLLFDYKDAYNLRDFNAVRGLYTEDALIMSFPCNYKEEVFFKAFSESLPVCANYWVEGAFKLRLFKITSFSVEGDKCTARLSWDYRDNRGRGAFTPTFEFRKVDGDWKISREIYGRKNGH